MHGGMVTLRLHNTCWLSSYLVDLRKKDKKPEGSLLLSLTWGKEKEVDIPTTCDYTGTFVHKYKMAKNVNDVNVQSFVDFVDPLQ